MSSLKSDAFCVRLTPRSGPPTAAIVVTGQCAGRRRQPRWRPGEGADHAGFDRRHDVKSLGHPSVVRLDLNFEAPVIAETPQRMVLYTAEPRSVAVDGLVLLARD